MTTARLSGPSWSMRELDEVGRRAQPLAPLGGELVGRDDPAVLAARPGEGDDVLHAGDLAAHALELGDLIGVLGEDDACCRSR